MIYLCKPCGLCSQMCGSACDGVKKCCGNACSACGDACNGFFSIFSSITKFPLGGFVMGTWITMIIVLGCSGVTLAETNCSDVQTFCFVNCGLSVVHFVVARYIQWRIVQKIQVDMGGSSAENKDIPHSVIATAAYHIALYDIGFCLYFFVFFGSFGYNCYGMSNFGDCEVGTGPGWSAGAIMILWGIGVWNYFFCWYCMQVCCGKAKKGPQAGSPAPQQVGA